MKLPQFFFLLLLSSSSVLNAQSTPDPSAALEVRSTTQGFLPPGMTTAQRDAIASPARGLIIFNTSTNGLNFYNGLEWIELPLVEARTVLSASGKIWQAKNLGADQIATSSTDAAAYGYLYQWGRNADGHEFRTSSTAAGPVASGSEGSHFITASSDWLSVPDGTRWNGTTKGTHDPCPSGFRVPTETELNNERLLFPSNNAAGAFASVLKLPAAGIRYRTNGTLTDVGSYGRYWCSTVNSTLAHGLFFSSSNADVIYFDRGNGFSVRCIKE